MKILEKIATKFSNRNRNKKWKIFLDNFDIDINKKTLDVGFCVNEYKESDNFIEKKYPYPKNLTALGLEDSDNFRNKYSEINTVIYNGKKFPFKDKTFDICFSSAVLEHAGNENFQIEFLKEIKRVSDSAFLTTPNKYFPIEAHTRVFFLHYLPKKIFDKFLLLIGKKWATGDYMNLLSKKDIEKMLNKAGIKKFKIIKNKILFFTIDYLIIF